MAEFAYCVKANVSLLYTSLLINILASYQECAQDSQKIILQSGIFQNRRLQKSRWNYWLDFRILWIWNVYSEKG